MYRHSPLQPAATALKRTPAADIIGDVKVQSNLIKLRCQHLLKRGTLTVLHAGVAGSVMLFKFAVKINIASFPAQEDAGHFEQA